MHFADLLVAVVESSDFRYCVVTGEDLDLCRLPDIVGPIQRDSIRH